ncbi:MAG: hypothetical protein CMH66_06315 [Nioella sp.]|nr:hypothetical protein [Nioella sp.]
MQLRYRTIISFVTLRWIFQDQFIGIAVYKFMHPVQDNNIRNSPWRSVSRAITRLCLVFFHDLVDK